MSPIPYPISSSNPAIKPWKKNYAAVNAAVLQHATNVGGSLLLAIGSIPVVVAAIFAVVITSNSLDEAEAKILAQLNARLNKLSSEKKTKIKQLIRKILKELT